MNEVMKIGRSYAWAYEPFALNLEPVGQNDCGMTTFRYRFTVDDEVVFEGEDYHSHEFVGPNRVVVGLLVFLACKPGDVDPEYFRNYTAKQLAFANKHGEELSLVAHDLENEHG